MLAPMSRKLHFGHGRATFAIAAFLAGQDFQQAEAPIQASVQQLSLSLSLSLSFICVNIFVHVYVNIYLYECMIIAVINNK